MCRFTDWLHKALNTEKCWNGTWLKGSLLLCLDHLILDLREGSTAEADGLP